MTDYLDTYQLKMRRRGRNRYERNYNKKKRSFNYWFAQALNKEECLVDGVPAELVFQDHSQSNTKGLSDDKYVIADNMTKIDIGSYIEWRDMEWLVYNGEQKTIPTHQQYQIQEVNWTVKWLRNGEIINNGKGYGAHVRNQTLYTLGVSFVGDLASLANAKMMMFLQANDDTRNIKIGQRLYIGRKVYKILFVDEISRDGIVNCLMEQDQEHKDYDNPELRIADYYRGGKNPSMNAQVKPDNPTDNQANSTEKVELTGTEQARISSTHIFRLSETKHVVTEWNVVNFNSNNNPFQIKRKDEKEIELHFKDEFRNIGDSVTIFATLDDGRVVQKATRIIKKY